MISASHQTWLQLSLDDSKLLQFLRGCKFSLERSKEKMDLYNSCRSQYKPVILEFLDRHETRATLPDWFFPWDPSFHIFQKVLNWGSVSFLKAHNIKIYLVGTGCLCLAMTSRAGRSYS